MNNRRTMAFAGVLVASILVVSLVLPAIASGRPANRIPVTDIKERGEALEDPTAPRWKKAEPTPVALASAPSGLPNADSVGTHAVTVSAIRSPSEMYVKFEWEDDTKNASTETPTAFADGVAMQVPVNTSSQPNIALGSTSNTVNVWYWQAAEGTESLLAGGMGTITEMNTTPVKTQAVHEDGSWSVVMHRSITMEGTDRPDLDQEERLNVAFAVWDGANGERSGHHAVSEWSSYWFGPTQTGPGYQYVLWAIAGIALTIALLVTIRATRRTAQK